jgi:two-component system sensor histidine kinase UhpB
MAPHVEARHTALVDVRGTSLSWRVFIANAVVLCVAAAVLLISPVTVSHPVSAREAAVVVGGLCVMVVLNLWLVRRTLEPLNRLADDMDRIDLLEDDAAAIGPPPSGDEELVRLLRATRRCSTACASSGARARAARRRPRRRSAGTWLASSTTRSARS